MPVVTVQMLQGRPLEKRRTLIQRVTEAVVESIDVRPEQVRVVIQEIPPEHWGIGGVTVADRQAAVTP